MMAKQPKKKKASKADRQRAADRRRGVRRGQPVRSIQMRLPVDLVEWVDETARRCHLNRTQYVRMLLDGARRFEAAADDAGLFQDVDAHVERLVQRVLEQMPAPEIRRLLDQTRKR